MKFFCLIIALTLYAFPVWAGSVLVENKSAQKIKISAIGGSAYVEADSEKSISFKNEENGATLNIWWVKNARQLCQIFTPWERTIIVTGKHTIQCLSKK